MAGKTKARARGKPRRKRLVTLCSKFEKIGCLRRIDMKRAEITPNKKEYICFLPFRFNFANKIALIKEIVQ